MADIMFIILLNEVERMNRRRHFRRLLRNLRDSSDPFSLSDGEFIKNFRLSKYCVLMLYEELIPHLQNNRRTTGIPPNLKGNYQHSVGTNHLLGVSQPTVSRCVSEVSRAINNHLSSRWIKFPTRQELRNIIIEGFQNKYNINGVVGAIDCTHISIIAPPIEDPVYPARVYYCRKGYTSINTQIICDSNLVILNINAKFPGSAHDSAIWITSGVKRHLKEEYLNGRHNFYLLGDSGYPLEPWLMTPVDDAVDGTPESRYNEVHSRARNCIERLNGVLKSRFRALLRHRTLNYHPIKAALIINSCATLHNIAKHYNVNMPEDAVEEDQNNAIQNLQLQAPLPNNQDRQWYMRGLRVRNNLIESIN